jgi:MFS family permease
MMIISCASFSAWKHDDAPNLGAAFAAKVAQAANEERYWWRRLIQPLPSTMLTPEQRWRRKLYVILASLTVAVGLVLGPHTRDIITAAAQPTGAHWTNAEHAAHGFGLTLIIIFAALAFIYPKIFSGTQAVARFINDPKSEAARGSIDSVSRQLGNLITSATRGNRVHSGVGSELRFRWPVQPAVAGSHGFPARARVMASRAVRLWFAVESR